MLSSLDELSLVLLAVDAKPDLRSARCVCKAWRALLTKALFKRWRDARNQLPACAQRELCRLVAVASALTDGDRLRMAALLDAVRISLVDVGGEVAVPLESDDDVPTRVRGTAVGVSFTGCKRYLVLTGCTLVELQDERTRRARRRAGEEGERVEKASMQLLFVRPPDANGTSMFAELCRLEHFPSRSGPEPEEELVRCRSSGPALEHFIKMLSAMMPQAALAEGGRALSDTFSPGLLLTALIGCAEAKLAQRPCTLSSFHFPGPLSAMSTSSLEGSAASSRSLEGGAASSRVRLLAAAVDQQAASPGFGAETFARLGVNIRPHPYACCCILSPEHHDQVLTAGMIIPHWDERHASGLRIVARVYKWVGLHATLNDAQKAQLGEAIEEAVDECPWTG